MHLTEIEIERLRNLAPARLNLPPGLTVVMGANGQGKTSLLEAIYLLGTGRSFRTRRLAEAVRWNDGPLRLGGSLALAHGTARLAVCVEGPERSLSVNGESASLEDYLGYLAVVDLTASRMSVLQGAPADRRRFIDRGLVGQRPAVLRVLGEYRRVLAQRNALLRRHGARTRSGHELDAWDERLAAAAARLHAERRAFCERLGRRALALGADLFGAAAGTSLRYEPSPPPSAATPADGLVALFGEALRRARSRDLDLGHTSEGPHRDDLVVESGGVDLRRFGSAGQVRGAVITLKLAKLTLLREDRGEAPLFLLDDFDSDLDDGRLTALTGFLREGGFQAIVATSKEGRAGRTDGALNLLRMDRGVAAAA